jgi:limonene-1,2-epoxide hydrolase
MRCGALRVASSGGVVFTERVDHFNSNGKTVEHYLVAVFEVNVDGKIAAWREYFDPDDVNRQLRTAARASP